MLKLNLDFVRPDTTGPNSPADPTGQQTATLAVLDEADGPHPDRAGRATGPDAVAAEHPEQIDRAVRRGDTRRRMRGSEEQEARPNLADRGGMIGPYGVRYSWAYWVAILAAFALLVVDIFDDGPLWNYGVIVLLVIAVVIQPGGIRGPRYAARAEKRRGDAGGT